MSNPLWMDQQARLFCASDMDIYLAIKESLPPEDISACCGTGPHNYPAMRTFASEAKAVNLLEIGFNQGVSSMFWAFTGISKRIVSVDIESRPSHIKAVFELCERASIEFRFIHGDSSGIGAEDVGHGFSAAFVDGDHTYGGILKDIESCRRIGVTDFLFDDWLPRYGDTQSAVQDSGLRVVWVMGNMAYCRDDLDRFSVFEK